SDAPTRSDDETVRSSVGHPESALLEVRHHGRLVRVGRGVERVELLLAQELPVARRRRILNGGEKRFGRLRVTQREHDYEAMLPARCCRAEVDRLGDEWGQRARIRWRPSLRLGGVPPRGEDA